MLKLDDRPGLLQWRVLAEKLRLSLARRSARARSTAAHRLAFYEAVWLDAAAELGATVSPLGYGVLEIRRGSRMTRVSNNYTPLDDSVTLAIAGNKPHVFALLAKANLPIPQHLEFRSDSLAAAMEFLTMLSGDAVIKPARDTGAGQGVTTGICTKSQLVHAAIAAAAFGEPLLIEQQILGDVYRLLYLDGKLLDAVIRKPPTVIGNGHSTIRRLVEITNAARAVEGIKFGQALLTNDLDMRQTLDRQALTLDSIVAAGQVVQVKTVNNENSGPDNEPAADVLCQAIVAAGAQAAATVGARLAAVDIIAADPRIPLERSGGVILEVNTTPGYYYHYYRLGGPAPVARAILECLLEVDHRPVGLMGFPLANAVSGTSLNLPDSTGLVP